MEVLMAGMLMAHCEEKLDSIVHGQLHMTKKELLLRRGTK